MIVPIRGVLQLQNKQIMPNGLGPRRLLIQCLIIGLQNQNQNQTYLSNLIFSCFLVLIEVVARLDLNQEAQLPNTVIRLASSQTILYPFEN